VSLRSTKAFGMGVIGLLHFTGRAQFTSYLKSPFDRNREMRLINNFKN
jgi:hypothetical protein